MDNQQTQLQAFQEQFTRLSTDFDALQQNYYKNNSNSHQDFVKSCSFATTLKIPVYTTLPPSKEVGEICAYTTGGTTKLMISTAVDTWTICGSQS